MKTALLSVVLALWPNWNTYYPYLENPEYNKAAEQIQKAKIIQLSVPGCFPCVRMSEDLNKINAKDYLYSDVSKDNKIEQILKQQGVLDNTVGYPKLLLYQNDYVRVYYGYDWKTRETERINLINYRVNLDKLVD